MFGWTVQDPLVFREYGLPSDVIPPFSLPPKGRAKPNESGSSASAPHFMVVVEKDLAHFCACCGVVDIQPLNC